MNGLSRRQLERRFLTLRASRWLATGLLVPIFVLFLVDRGMSLTQIGLIVAAQGGAVLLLEMPTGGLADALGRRRVLLLANLVDLAALALLLVGSSLAWFLVAFALEGVYRALESGPLDAWYVDAVHTLDRDADIERGLSRGGVAIGLAIAGGSLLSGALVALDPVPDVGALTVPLIAAIAFRGLDTILVWALMTEIRPPLGWSAVTDSAKEIPSLMGGAFRLVRGSAVLTLLLAVEAIWGFSALAWEGLFPAKLGEIMGGEEAAALMGPVSAVAWATFAAGSALAPWLSARLGRFRVAAGLRLAQGVTLVAMGALAGIPGLVIAFLACYSVFGASGPIHMTLVHDRAEAHNRTTVTSLNNMVGMAAAAIGGIVLGAIADGAGKDAAMLAAAAITAVAGPMYLLAGRRSEREVKPETTPA